MVALAATVLKAGAFESCLNYGLVSGSVLFMRALSSVVDSGALLINLYYFRYHISYMT
jgi:hypothetical protein